MILNEKDTYPGDLGLQKAFDTEISFSFTLATTGYTSPPCPGLNQKPYLKRFSLCVTFVRYFVILCGSISYIKPLRNTKYITKAYQILLIQHRDVAVIQ
jgi:hypothetical protein